MANKAQLGDLYTSNNEFDANVTITVGNTTVNVSANSTMLRYANSTAATNVAIGLINVGTSSINTTAIAEGANVILTTAGLIVGNTTSNLLANSTAVKISNVTHNAVISLSGISGTAVSVTYDAVPTPQGRLSANSTNPVDDGAVATARTTIYYHPYVGNLCPNYNGTTWDVLTIAGAGISLALESNASNTGYHQSGKNFDLYLYNDSGTTRLVTGPAWTSDIARAQAISRFGGMLTNSGSQTVRYGTGTAATTTMAANRGTYLGTFRATAGGSTQYYVGEKGTPPVAAVLGLWNFYNQRRISKTNTDTGVSYTFGSGSTRQVRNASTLRLSRVVGIVTNNIDIIGGIKAVGVTASGYWICGVMFNSTTTFSNMEVLEGYCGIPGWAGSAFQITAPARDIEHLGWNYYQLGEFGSETTQSWHWGYLSYAVMD